MKSGKLKISLITMLASAAVFAAGAGLLSVNKKAAYAESADYDGSYRNRLSYSAKAGWNNDPNGLLYADGVYHMYYQYTWDERNHTTQSWWDHMSWGHATSTDLVHWTELPVAIPAYWDGEGTEHMMFSGSAVYDEYNTSGLFETENGKVKANQGIVAVLTQPSDKDGGQRQILAYSKDGGTSFTLYGEVLGANSEGSLGDGEFRDPKIFWNGTLNKWLMAVGGGSVRMYSSDNLINWSYLGETGFWGECPDISRYEVDGKEKYALILSPEDKTKSHEYNGTTRTSAFYPAEYYVVGELDENGLFRSTQPIKRLSEGIDCYAFQSFNNTPDGKVYGVSWSASWLTVGAYEGYRDGYNGGMTAVCELKLVEDGEGFTLLRNPVENYNTLRCGETAKVSGKIEAGKNPLANVKANEADIEAELDFTDSAATYAELSLRVSAEEKTVIRYDLNTQTLSLDRSQSSLLAKDTNFYKNVYKKSVPLENGKLSLRILLDRAFVSVFANGGKASYFSAVFPSAISDNMALTSDGAVGYDIKVYSVESIFGGIESKDELLLTTSKIDTTAGATEAVIASSYFKDFNINDVSFEVVEGGENISLTVEGGTAYIKALKKGSAKVKVSYKGVEKFIEVYIYNNGFISNVNFSERYRAFTFLREDGLFLGAGKTDAFLFGDMSGENIDYSATFAPQENAQAGGLAFGYTGNASGYWFVTADVKDNAVKLVEFCGEKEAAKTLKEVSYAFPYGADYKLSVNIKDGQLNAFVNGAKVLEETIENYTGGRVGLNVYNADMVVNKVTFTSFNQDGGIFIGEDEVIKVVNVTDLSYRLKEGEYTLSNGTLYISDKYLKTLNADTEYTFRAVTASSEYDAVIKTEFEQSTLTPVSEEVARGENVSFTVSGNPEIYKVEINGEQTEFTLKEGVITVSGEALKNLTGGTHSIKAYTSNGRPTADFRLNSLPDFTEEEVTVISRTFFWIDIAIFATLIICYVTYTVIKKVRAK